MIKKDQLCRMKSELAIAQDKSRYLYEQLQLNYSQADIMERQLLWEEYRAFEAFLSASQMKIKFYEEEMKNAKRQKK